MPNKFDKLAFKIYQCHYEKGALLTKIIWEFGSYHIDEQLILYDVFRRA